MLDTARQLNQDLYGGIYGKCTTKQKVIILIVMIVIAGIIMLVQSLANAGVLVYVITGVVVVVIIAVLVILYIIYKKRNEGMLTEPLVPNTGSSPYVPMPNEGLLTAPLVPNTGSSPYVPIIQDYVNNIYGKRNSSDPYTQQWVNQNISDNYVSTVITKFNEPIYVRGKNGVLNSLDKACNGRYVIYPPNFKLITNESVNYETAVNVPTEKGTTMIAYSITVNFNNETKQLVEATWKQM